MKNHINENCIVIQCAEYFEDWELVDDIDELLTTLADFPEEDVKNFRFWVAKKREEEHIDFEQYITDYAEDTYGDVAVENLWFGDDEFKQLNQKMNEWVRKSIGAWYDYTDEEIFLKDEDYKVIEERRLLKNEKVYQGL